jgi:hypothetical protein
MGADARNDGKVGRSRRQIVVRRLGQAGIRRKYRTSDALFGTAGGGGDIAVARRIILLLRLVVDATRERDKGKYERSAENDWMCHRSSSAT